MTSLAVIAAPSRQIGLPPDPVAESLRSVALHGGRLAVAMLSPWEREKLADALSDARGALAEAERRGRALSEALSPATEDSMDHELTRLVRAWPQDKRGDLTGYAAELALFVIERRPSRRALEQACRALKLGKVHLPSIAEVMTALAAAESEVLAASAQLNGLPTRIAKAEAILAPRPAKPDNPVVEVVVAAR